MDQKYIQTWKEKGYRNTKIRTAIMDIFSQDDVLLSAQNVIDELKTQDLHVNKTTVYREIDFLVSQRFLIEVELGDRKKRYERIINGHHHHVVCTSCHAVEHIALSDDLVTEQERIEKKTNFRITDHFLEFFGLCKKCQ